MHLREATTSDAEAIRAIYNDAVATPFTFDLRPRSLEEQQAWLRERSGAHAAIVATDGEQVVVGGAGRAVEPGSSGKSDAGKVSLNRATQADFEALPGIGPVTATNIIAWRTEHGSFTAVEELQEVTGIGPKTFAKLKSLVSL